MKLSVTILSNVPYHTIVHIKKVRVNYLRRHAICTTTLIHHGLSSIRRTRIMHTSSPSTTLTHIHLILLVVAVSLLHLHSARACHEMPQHQHSSNRALSSCLLTLRKGAYLVGVGTVISIQVLDEPEVGDGCGTGTYPTGSGLIWVGGGRLVIIGQHIRGSDRWGMFWLLMSVTVVGVLV